MPFRRKAMIERRRGVWRESRCTLDRPTRADGFSRPAPLPYTAARRSGYSVEYTSGSARSTVCASSYFARVGQVNETVTDT